MAFTGVALVKQVSDRLVRITGLSLAGAAAGTISLSGGVGDVKCPVGFQPKGYETVGGVDVTLQQSVWITMIPVTSIVTLVPIMVVKTGTLVTDLLLTLTNTTAATASAEQEIYIGFH